MNTHLILILIIAFTTGCNRLSSKQYRSESETTEAQSDNGPASMSPVKIANDTDANQDNLSVTVKTIHPNIQMQNSVNRNPAVCDRARIEFSIHNKRGSSIHDVDIKLLVQPGLKLAEFDFGSTDLRLVKRNEDFTEFSLKRLLEFQSGQALNFSATVEGAEPGAKTFEVQVSSMDVPETVVGHDSVNVSD